MPLAAWQASCSHLRVASPSIHLRTRTTAQYPTLLPTLHLLGLDLARFQSITEPQLLAVLRQRLTATANGAPVEVYVASVSAVPAGVTLAGDASGIGAGAGRRRSLRQATGEWLQMVLVANGPDPLAMYAAIKKAVRCGGCARAVRVRAVWKAVDAA